MTIHEGSYANYAEDIRHPEFVAMDRSQADKDNVVAIDHPRLVPGTTLKEAALPFEVKVDAYYPNSDMLGPNQERPADLPKATAGAGLTSAAVPTVKVAGVAM